MNELKAAGITIIVVEQNARMGLQFADWGCVLDLGKAVFEGPSETVLADPRIEELYLGRRARARGPTDDPDHPDRHPRPDARRRLSR